MSLAILILPLRATGAADSSRFRVYAGLGAAYPYGSLGTQSVYGWHAMGGVALVPSRLSPDIEIVIRAAFDKFPPRDGLSRSQSVYELGLDFRFRLPYGSDVRPFLLAGIGYSRLSLKKPADDPPTASDVTENDLSVSPGIGLDIRAARSARYFVEVRLVEISSHFYQNFQFIRLTAGIRL
ncbi:MAG TPA: hypothetical protein VMS71_01610 [Candidatus Acidoferrum sp.]|nr:hypothetical protein [Candidatus Acidoferrum sp.]